MKKMAAIYKGKVSSSIEKLVGAITAFQSSNHEVDNVFVIKELRKEKEELRKETKNLSKNL